jgi:hypothetical protein
MIVSLRELRKLILEEVDAAATPDMKETVIELMKMGRFVSALKMIKQELGTNLQQEAAFDDDSSDDDEPEWTMPQSPVGTKKVLSPRESSVGSYALQKYIDTPQPDVKWFLDFHEKAGGYETIEAAKVMMVALAVALVDDLVQKRTAIETAAEAGDKEASVALAKIDKWIATMEEQRKEYKLTQFDDAIKQIKQAWKQEQAPEEDFSVKEPQGGELEPFDSEDEDSTEEEDEEDREWS